MKLRLTAKDFDKAITDRELDDLPFMSDDPKAPSLAKRYAEIANARIKEILEKAPRVCLKMAGPNKNLAVNIYPVRHGTSTHRARLVEIEELGEAP